jgi:hypothetical protein
MESAHFGENFPAVEHVFRSGAFLVFRRAGDRAMSDAALAHRDRQWYIVGRWQEYAGEARANLLRVISLVVFYSLQLVEHYWFVEPAQRDLAFHRAATALAAAGLFAALGVQLCLQRRIFPQSLKFISTTVDIALVTGLAALGGGPHSPVRLVYFLIIALAALRFSLPLVWFANIAAALGYLALVGLADKTWFDAEHAVRPIEQLMTLTSLVLTGVVMGQVTRHARKMAEGYRQRATAHGEGGAK